MALLVELRQWVREREIKFITPFFFNSSCVSKLLYSPQHFGCHGKPYTRHKCESLKGKDGYA